MELEWLKRSAIRILVAQQLLNGADVLAPLP
jgi:hypothetical protein